MELPISEGIKVKTITTHRISTRVLTSGPDHGVPVLFMHGYMTTASVWQKLMLSLPSPFRGIAFDQRGVGGADPNKFIDATRGQGDLVDDAVALMDTLQLQSVHLVVHSMASLVAHQLIRTLPHRLLSVSTLCPSPPFGSCSTSDSSGTLTFPDGAGSGAAMLSTTPYLVVENMLTSEPVKGFIWQPGFGLSKRGGREGEVIKIYAAHPGEVVPSPHWPFFAPGKTGMLNASSPLYLSRDSRLVPDEKNRGKGVGHKPAILWIRGEKDKHVCDESEMDPAVIGKEGRMEGWPGIRAHPPQPMFTQTKVMMEQYEQDGGKVVKVVLNVAHAPHLEKPHEVSRLLNDFLVQQEKEKGDLSKKLVSKI